MAFAVLILIRTYKYLSLHLPARPHKGHKMQAIQEIVEHEGLMRGRDASALWAWDLPIFLTQPSSNSSSWEVKDPALSSSLRHNSRISSAS